MTTFKSNALLNDYLQNVLNHKESPNLDNAIELLNDFCISTYNLNFNEIEADYTLFNLVKNLLLEYFTD